MLDHSLQGFLVSVPSVSSLLREGQRTLEFACSCFSVIRLKLHGLLTAKSYHYVQRPFFFYTVYYFVRLCITTLF